jgi:AraC-like DNA-binding protein
VTDWIRRRRLDHCKRELLDPRNAGESISTIAARWGLADSSHFSRLFRTTYGMSPREFRSRAPPQYACSATSPLRVPARWATPSSRSFENSVSNLAVEGRTDSRKNPRRRTRADR